LALARQATARAEWSHESLKEALTAVLRTEPGRGIGQLRGAPHRDERADRWQLSQRCNRAEERRKGQLEEPKRFREEERGRARKAEWERFVRGELRELELRKHGKLAELLGAALAGAPTAVLRRLAALLGTPFGRSSQNEPSTHFGE